MLLQQPGEWDDCLDLVSLAYNTSRHSTTGFTPFFLTNGHEARMPANVLLPKNMPSSSTPGSPADYVAQLTLMWIFPGVTCRIHYLLDQSDKSQTVHYNRLRLYNAPVPDCGHKTPNCDSSLQPQLPRLTALSGALPFKPSTSAALMGYRKPGHLSPQVEGGTVKFRS